MICGRKEPLHPPCRKRYIRTHHKLQGRTFRTAVQAHGAFCRTVILLSGQPIQDINKVMPGTYILLSATFTYRQKLLDNIHLQTIAATGHYPMIEKPTVFNLILEKVLKSMK